ncbi:MAG: hypothetical protein DPW09_03840 [Anaerolineae bacterium]|nr:hypothetical protein [Anaerolineales bacterium]MCQ3972563.1 hypothetical protein [Anaerolineae bacterium]
MSQLKSLICLSHLTFHLREWAILGLFTLVTFIMLYPFSISLTTMAPEPNDPLLNVWRLHWNVHAWLGGPTALANIFNTNILYPFPLTLAYSEHFFILSAQVLPFLLISDSHLVGLNVSVLLTFILSGYGMYLLVTAWTGNRWAGLVAGILFAFSPNRFGRFNHLELLVTQWMPLALLALHWTLTRPGWRYPFLLGLFFNFQALSGFHYSLNLTIACALLALVYVLSGRVYWRWSLSLAIGLSTLVTLLINGPIWQVYLRFSDVMGAVRTPGEVRIYSAALTDYLTAIPYNWLYGWTFGRWATPDHQTQPLMPVGLTGLLLALLGLLAVGTRLYRRRSHRSNPWQKRAGGAQNFGLPTIVFLFVLVFVFLWLSFGVNEAALGPRFVSLLRYSPYFWLYDHVVFFQGIRGVGRNSIMVVVGLAALAGWGAATLFKVIKQGFKVQALVLIVLILLESWSAPLRGPEIPTGSQTPPVYTWLRTETPADAIVLELPHRVSIWAPKPSQRVFDTGVSEFIYEYYSSYHWRRIANGSTGFTPPIYERFRQWFATFPDARSVDVIQQLGIDFIILHTAAYKPEDMQRLLADLRAYLPSFTQAHQIGESLVLRVGRPECRAQPDQIKVSMKPAPGLDGLSRAMRVTYHNEGVAAFVADAQRVSHLTFSGGGGKNFIEPLVTPAGEAESILVPLHNEQQADLVTGAWLATLDRPALLTEKISPGSPLSSQSGSAQWQPLSLKFAPGPQLLAYSLQPQTPSPCNKLTLALKWADGQAGDTATVRLLDPFGRLVLEHTARPWAETGQEIVATQTLPLPGSLPAGRYSLRISVASTEGQERLAVTAAGATIPAEQLPPLPLVIHPARLSLPSGVEPANQPVLGEAIRLLGSQLSQAEPVKAGDWLRFTLFWQAEHPIKTNLTVFTQLLGSDGRVWGQWDNQPKGGWYSTSLWLPKQPIADDYAFPIDAAAPPGEYHLIVGMYDSATGQRVAVSAGPNQGSNFIEIATVRVAKP